MRSHHTQLHGRETYLFIELDENWLIEFLVILTPVVDVLGVAETLVEFGFVWHEVSIDWSGQTILRNWDVLSVSNLFEFDMRYFLVGNVRWVVGGNVTWEFWEV